MTRVQTGMGMSGKLGSQLSKVLMLAPSLLWYYRQKKAFETLYAASTDRSFAAGKLYPCFLDRFAEGGEASGYFFQQNQIVAELIYETRPTHHVDVGSRIDLLVAKLALFCPVEVIDYRPVTTTARNISYRQADIMRARPELENITDSLSSVDALECFGLGRYGEPLDPDGHRKGFRTLARMVRPGGMFYFAVPISNRQRYEFNAHRIFSLPYLLELVDTHGLDIRSFHYVDDAGAAHTHVDHRSGAAARTFGLHCGAGIFVLVKRG